MESDAIEEMKEIKEEKSKSGSKLLPTHSLDTVTTEGSATICLRIKITPKTKEVHEIFYNPQLVSYLFKIEIKIKKRDEKKI